MRTRSQTNLQVRKRIYAYEGGPIRATLRTQSRQVEVRLQKQTVIDVLTNLAKDEPCPCRFTVRKGQGYLIPIEQGPPPR